MALARPGRGSGGGRGAAALLLLMGLAAPARADAGSEWAALLGIVVRDDGVDYEELARGRAVLDAYLKGVAEAPPEAADAAFRINAYNAIVLRLALDAGPAPVPASSFDGRAWKVAGREATLDALEREIVAAAGPLARFALHRATRGSPALSAALYRSDGLADALRQQARLFVSDEGRNVFRYAQLEAELSMLFHRHREDFEPLQDFLADHLPKERDEATGEPRDGAIARSLRTTAWRISFRPDEGALDRAGAGPRRPHPAWLALYGLAAAALLWFGVRSYRSLLRRPPAPPPVID